MTSLVLNESERDSFVFNHIKEYKVIEWIGEGVSADIYHVEKDGMSYAMKVLKNKHSLEELKYNQLLSGVPYFITFYESFWFEEQYCMVLEKVDGTLAQWISDQFYNGYEYEMFTKSIILQLLGAIYLLDQYQLSHTDLKPENIGYILTENGPEIRILDFGLMMPYGISVRMMGTPCYTVPDLFTDSFKTSSVCDLWSIGTIAHEMVTGNQLCTGIFYSKSNKDNMKKIYDSIHKLSHSDYKGKVENDDDFFRLIEDILIKRINIHQALSHTWFH